jgi:hypothetical protein
MTTEGLARAAYGAYAGALGIGRTPGGKTWEELPPDRKRAWLAVAGVLTPEPGTRAPWDPLPHLAALIDGLGGVVRSPGGPADRIALAHLLAGPYAALRGGLLLDEPGREHLSTEAALREALEGAEQPRVLRDVNLVSWGPVLDPPWPGDPS